LVAVVGGRAIASRPTRSGLEFRLPAGTCRVTLRSRSAVPAEMKRADPDHRRLGIFVQALWLDGERVPLTDPRLTAGWHAPELAGQARWTDGAGVIESPAPARALAVATVPLLSYWAEAAAIDPAARRSRC
jgi:hypothetical protein